MEKVYLAADTSNNNGLLILFNEREILYEGKIEKKFDHGKKLGELLLKANNLIESRNLHLTKILVGVGPGSFVGIRIALATFLGFSLAKNLPLSSFCSHKALLYSVNAKNALIYILTKAYGDVYYLSVFFNGDEIKEKRTTTFKDFFLNADKNSSVLTDDKQNYQLDIFNDVIFIESPTYKGLWHVAKEKIDKNLEKAYEDAKIKVEYVASPNIRPLMSK